MSIDLTGAAQLPFCYLTTTGRVSGRAHTIEIWFALRNQTIYMLAGDHGSDWVKNIRKQPETTLRIDNRMFAATGRMQFEADEEVWARQALVTKYQDGYAEDLTEWGRTALLVAVDLGAEQRQFVPKPTGGPQKI
jgi:deazaflavin-dependent oxidoreductase (nitroreductase family)